MFAKKWRRERGDEGSIVSTIFLNEKSDWTYSARVKAQTVVTRKMNSQTMDTEALDLLDIVLYYTRFKQSGAMIVLQLKKTYLTLEIF